MTSLTGIKNKQWTLEDLVDACSDALYEMEGITRGVSVRTIQNDLQVMRSDRLGYNAPIEVNLLSLTTTDFPPIRSDG